MPKTTVYLPDDLKRYLEELAAASGRSEAQLIRDGIAALTRSAPRPRPHGELYASSDPSLSSQVGELLAGFGTR